MVLVVFYGALLRFDAITLRYGPHDRPGWLGALESWRAARLALRPAQLTWANESVYPHADGPPTRYRSDPYTYLRYAREMRSFYAAHRREPLFPFTTRVFLLLFDQQDVAVSYASAFFSLLAIIATFLLGSSAFSRWVGLGAAVAMAIEYDVVSWGVEGWRDDAFTCAVVMSAYAMLRYLRDPSRQHAILVGIVGGLACLIRITSLSFLLPGLVYLLFASSRGWRHRFERLGLAVLLLVVIVGPFLFNCWVAFGDPLHAINVHADVYREAEGQAGEPSRTAAQYLSADFHARPMRTLDTVVLGMTRYPFSNKWQGFDQWLPSLGKWLSYAAMVGLVLFAGSPAGRLLLLVLGASLVPYAATWRLISDWRFTEHAYPFLLVAAFVPLAGLAALSPSRVRAWFHTPRPAGRLLFWPAVLAVVLLGVWLVDRGLPMLTVLETMRAGEPVMITAGDRDGSFFVEGWSVPLAQGNVTVRIAEGTHSVVRIPLAARRDCEVTLRLDPWPLPPADRIDLPDVRVFVNDRLVGLLHLQFNPDRVGAYHIHLPAGVASDGFNRMSLMATSASGATRPVRLWYVRVQTGGGRS